MTEMEWFDSENPLEMRYLLSNTGVRDRKMRLFCFAAASYFGHEGKHDAITDDYLVATNRKIAQAEEAFEAGKKLPTGSLWCLNRDIAQASCEAVTASRDPKHLEVLARLLREIFGNPFKPFTVNIGAYYMYDVHITEWKKWLAWNYAKIPSMARMMYNSQDFSGMPILADALEDAGCCHEGLLVHCREDRKHVRGCWVVDMLLGKD